MRTITLYNSFHGTHTNVKLIDGFSLNHSQLQRVRRALCGSKTCRCQKVTRAEENGKSIKFSRVLGLSGHSDTYETLYFQEN